MQFSISHSALKVFGIVLSMLLHTSESRTLTLTPDQGTTITISRRVSGSKCTVCTVEGPKQQCYTAVTLTGTTTVEFKCSHPEQLFRVDIHVDIACTEKSCSRDIVQGESLPFLDFNRTFTWDLKTDHSRSFEVAFSEVGMRQILPSEKCPDQHTYTFTVYQATGPATIGTFCRNGSITTILALSKARVLLEVPGGRKLDPAVYNVSVGTEIKTFAVVEVALPRGSSAADFFSPNYPNSFPDDDLMTWDFELLPRHFATVHFLNYTKPECMKKDAVVEYHRPGKFTIVKELEDPQPTGRQGDFSLFLRNCEMERGTNASGLSLHFQVSVARSRPEFCTVDLRTEKGLVLHIEKDAKSNCELKQDSVIQDKITVSSGKATLSFQDCLSKDLNLTISKTIECLQWEKCPVGQVPLAVPALETCLPKPLRKITWHLQAPDGGTVELLPSSGSLRQSLPGQRCNSSFSLTVAEDSGVTVGSFCPLGPIRKVQIHGSVSITVTPTGSKDLSQASKPFFNISFSKEIRERYMFTVSPEKDTSMILGTPSWPAGMKSSSTVSWLVSVPPEYQAELVFTDISQPKCRNGHTSIKVQTLGSKEEMFSRREDEKAEVKLTVPESFYLNMSNCQPENGEFNVLSQITLQKKTSLLLGIILGTVGALLLLMLIVLIIVCVVIRKKKRQMAHAVSIYNPNGNTYLPGHPLFPKTRADNESHIYASIDDTMVYGHLLQESSYPVPMNSYHGTPQVDIYRSFTGPVEAPPPPLPHDRVMKPHTEIENPEVDVYRPFVDPSESVLPVPHHPVSHEDSMGIEDMVDNELYTSNGKTSLPHALTNSEQRAEQKHAA
ncbi:hypothetical protein MATL_G00133440 [Megalops atlanticus]|uniref:CUB domain-containing protein 1-like n=1 Tax=Megalops atlanticus TaxID=7932 RepID=A0A9D3PVX8_MEGAT|nr:hypothetical protein MATL_G00133440 [Megalops atlanticus]